MNTALEKTADNALTNTVNLPVDIAWPDLQAAIAGNLSKLSAEGRVKYYNALCQFTGLNPLGFPFEWVEFQGKLKLYAKKDCAEQLRGLHKITIDIVERVVQHGIMIVRARASMPDGRHDESIGAVPFNEKIPVEAANAMMKAETKAKRRVTLSMVGLGILDDEPERQATVSVERAGEESATARADLLNAELETNVIELKPEPTNAEAQRTQSGAESKPILHEPQPSKTAEVPPPVAANATTSGPEHPAVSPAAVEEPPDDFNEAPPSISEGEKLATELQLVFSEYPQPAACVDYVIFQKQLAKGVSLATIDPVYAKKILNNPKGFLRAVETWVRGGRK